MKEISMMWHLKHIPYEFLLILAGVGAATEDSGLSTGTIVAIVLGIIFLLLLILIIIVCCCSYGKLLNVWSYRSSQMHLTIMFPLFLENWKLTNKNFLHMV